MSQNDFTIANQGFPAFRADLNSALQALASNNSGATEPSTMFSNMWWYDSANNIMYIRNEDNDAWIKFAELDQANDKFVLSGTLQLDDGTVSAPALTFNSDTNMGIYRGGTDILKFVTAGTDAITIDASQDVTLAGSLTFADNEKAIFGAGSDLQIYHDSANGNSYIQDAGTGQLRLEADSVAITNTGHTEFVALFNENADVKLYYDGLEKLATTSTGIDVTGTADTTLKVTAGGTSNDSKIDFVQGTTTEGGITYDHNGTYSSEQMQFRAGNNSTHMVLNGFGNLGLGTSSPFQFSTVQATLTLSGTNGSFATRAGALTFQSQDTTSTLCHIEARDGYMAFSTGTSATTTERMRILSDGKLIVNQTANYSVDSKIELHSPASVPVSLYMLKAAQVEVNLGFKASTDSNFYINTGASTVGAAGKGVYLTNGGTSWNSNSDFRKKKNLVAIDNALDKIANCRAMTGHFNNEEDNVKKRPFLIAQDWLIALPEAVDENTVDDDGNENLGLSYEGTIPLLVACIKELREQNIALTARITALENGE